MDWIRLSHHAIHETEALIHEREPIYIETKLCNTVSNTLISVTLETEVLLVAFIHKIETLIVTRLSKNDNIKIFFLSLCTPLSNIRKGVWSPSHSTPRDKSLVPCE
jgi:hypothetical protein